MMAPASDSAQHQAYTFQPIDDYSLTQATGLGLAGCSTDSQ